MADLGYSPAMLGGSQILRPVEPVALRNTWREIRGRVEALSERFDEPWIADDVFAELTSLRSFLFATDDLSGFMVVRLFVTDYERTLFIWVGCNNGDPDISDYLPQVKEIAAGERCSEIRWVSPRKFHRAIPGVRSRFEYSVAVGGGE